MLSSTTKSLTFYSLVVSYQIKHMLWIKKSNNKDGKTNAIKCIGATPRSAPYIHNGEKKTRGSETAALLSARAAICDEACQPLCWHISPWRVSFIKRWAFACAALAGNHLSSIPINSVLIDVRCIKVNEAAAHLLSGEVERVLSLRGQHTHTHNAARTVVWGEGLAHSRGKRQRSVWQAHCAHKRGHTHLASLCCSPSFSSHAFLRVLYISDMALYKDDVYDTWLMRLNQLSVSNK